jgi:pimeloyl-ACP methyl ester carboxylesterase
MKILVGTLTLLLGVASTHAAKNIVIVHGAFADGSGWEGVHRILTKDGYNVTIVQNSTESLAADVTATQKVLTKQKGPVVLVGHSYGGEVITQAGNDSKVKSLVYVAAYVPDVGESLQSLITTADPSIAAPPIVFSNNEFSLDPEKFAAAFAADIDEDKAQFMAASQIPLGAQTFTDKITIAAWKTKPSYYIISTEDHMIPPADERKMAKRAHSFQFEIKASHAVFISQPEEVARVIKRAADE